VSCRKEGENGRRGEGEKAKVEVKVKVERPQDRKTARQ